MQEAIFIYFDSAQIVRPDSLAAFFTSYGMAPALVDINQNPAAQEETAKWTDGRTDVFPLVRVGDKIRALFFNPTPEALKPIFDTMATADAATLGNLPVTVLSADWCPDCRRLEGYFDRKAKPFTKINIETTPGAPEKIIRWSGGRRVVPTIRIGEDVLFFNPPPHVIGKFLGLEN
ncbi:MAG: glutaredoxin family protein [Blastocatellia bacterium]|nr:glutaredoxin family protein [Blastocatellia bacterium]